MPASPPTVIDLFAGAGGLSQSLERAGWRSVAAVDIDADAIATLRSNQKSGHLRGSRILQADIREIAAEDLRPDGVARTWCPDLLAGGPPCQPFSSAGSMRALDDPRGRLFHEFVRLTDALRPRFVLFENVSGLVTAKDSTGTPGRVLRRIQDEFEAIGYACRFDLLNAADYGAPQRRVRLYMVATRSGDLPSFPPPTHAREPDTNQKPWISLNHFLAKQGAPDAADIVRPKGRRAAELKCLLPGTGLRTGGLVEANRPGGHWGYRQDCFVADLNVPSRTIRAASTPDWLRQSDGELRRLTWRECAGLQGFPRDWNFVGATASRFRQIGNAVQGDIGLALGRALLIAASSMSRRRPRSAEWPAAFHKRVRYTAMEETVNGACRRAARGGANAGEAEALV